MTETYGILMRNKFGQIISDNDSTSICRYINGAASILGAYGGTVVDFSAYNATMNVDAVWNLSNFASPYWRCAANGTGTFYNKSWLALGGQTSIGFISTGVGNESPASTQKAGIYNLSKIGTGLIDSKIKMLKVRKHVVIQYSNDVITSPAGGGTTEGWIFQSSIDVSAYQNQGNIWVLVSPIMGMDVFFTTNIYTQACTLFAQNSTTFYIGDYVKLTGTAMRQVNYPAREVWYDVMFFTETH